MCSRARSSVLAIDSRDRFRNASSACEKHGCDVTAIFSSRMILGDWSLSSHTDYQKMAQQSGVIVKLVLVCLGLIRPPSLPTEFMHDLATHVQVPDKLTVDCRVYDGKIALLPWARLMGLYGAALRHKKTGKPQESASRRRNSQDYQGMELVL